MKELDRQTVQASSGAGSNVRAASGTGSGSVPKPEGSTWTDEQWEAIIRRGSNNLVAAAAGSGKTAVLVERIIRRIMDESARVDVDRLLVATFTNAAAAEMKERIREALHKKLEESPGSEHLRRQLALMGRASVTTLHAFCLELVQRHYSTIGLDPGFRIGNETEIELLKQETIEELLESYYETSDDDSPFWNLVESFGNDRGDGPLIQMILELHEMSRSQPWPSEWLLQAAGMFEEEADETSLRPWQARLLPAIALELRGAADMLREAISVAEQPGGPAPYASTFKEELEEVELLLALTERSWAELSESAASLPSRRLKPCRGDEVDAELKEQAAELRGKAKKAVDKLRSELLSRTESEYADELRLLAPQMRVLVDLVMTFDERFMQAKAGKGLLDFGDLEHYALAILRHADSTPSNPVPSLVAIECRERFDEVLIDEYQDTNSVQEAILDLISLPAPGNRFMVGDVKQSIYKFRLAEPGLFLAKYKAYGMDGTSGRKIDLARNFRSRSEVVDAVNFVFRQIMNETVGEIEYDAAAELIQGASYPEPSQDCAAEVILIDRGDGSAHSAGETIESADFGEDEEAAEDSAASAMSEAEELHAAQAEARAAARRIRELTGKGSEAPFLVYDKQIGGVRPAVYRDIVILLRATSAWAPVFVEELGRQGIPAYADMNAGYFEATEVEVMMSLLQIIDNPYQDIPLASVLRSPIMGLNAEELARLRIAGGRSARFYDAVLQAIKENDGHTVIPELPEGSYSPISDELRLKLAAFVNRLHDWRDEARQGALADLIWNVYRHTGYYDYVGALPGGGQRQANLRALYDRARQYESTSLRGLFRFLRFIRRMRDSGGDLGAARALGESEDVVRIMSIHKSKGLEFPIVFAAGMSKPFNKRDLNGAFLIHKELGFGPRFVDGALRTAYPTLPQLAIRRAMKLEALAEEMRVLYVALTRAKEKLFLIGGVKDLGKRFAAWSRMLEGADWHLPDYELAKASCYMDWLGPALIRHRLAGSWRIKAGRSAEAGGDLISHDSSLWKFVIVTMAQLNEDVHEEAAAFIDDSLLKAVFEGKSTSAVSNDKAGGLSRMLDWEYPHPNAHRFFGKTTVSELKRMSDYSAVIIGEGLPVVANEESIAPKRYGTLLRRPRFMEERSLTAAERGTVYHAVMQNLPLGQVPDTTIITKTIERMLEKEQISPAQRTVIDTDIILRFFETPIGRRMAVSTNVRRELPFTYGLRASELHPDADLETADETVLVQGVVDCLLEDEEGLTLLDYKTDRTGGQNVAELAERYRVQIGLYARAVGDIFKKPVNAAFLYYFDGSLLLPVKTK